MARRLVMGDVGAVQIDVRSGEGSIDQDPEKAADGILKSDALWDFKLVKFGGLHSSRLKVVCQRLQKCSLGPPWRIRKNHGTRRYGTVTGSAAGTNSGFVN